MATSFSFNLVDKVKKVLESFAFQGEPDKYYSAREIAEKIVELYPEDCQKKINASKNNKIKSLNDVTVQICAEITAAKERIKKIQTIDILLNGAGGKNKILFRYNSGSQEEKIEPLNEKLENNGLDSDISESCLYDKLREYLFTKGIYSMRIDEKTSSNTKGRGGNKWLFPDIVGIQDSSKDWYDGVKKLSKNLISSEVFSMYSFEVKLRINRSNVREYFFQAVSNSSWANYPYIVASEIDDRAKDELLMLAKSYSVGVILLDYKEVENTQILLYAPGQETPDWDIMSRIAEENKDFRRYVKAINDSVQLGEIRENDWNIGKFKDR